jgi:GT2 family glycosyltransferase
LISLIICSSTADLDYQLKTNIELTIGCSFEFIIINNSKNSYDIFEAYNLGVQRSKGEILCFLHDDIYFHTRNWGNIVINHFINPKIGAIGVAGSPYLAKAIGSWWSGGLINQHLCYQENSKIKISKKNNTKEKVQTKEVVILDGLWFCIKRELFQKVKFDEITFDGFHFYDLDICTQVFQNNYKILAISDILIQHDSAGNINDKWIENAKLFNQKWKRHLPISCIDISFNLACNAELRTIRDFSFISHNNSSLESYLFAINQIFNNYKLYFYYKTPMYLYSFLKKILIKAK